MDDLISRQAAIDAAIKADMENNSNVLSEKRARVIDRHISAVPSAQPETGYWISARDEDGWHMWLICSECRAKETNLKAKYCPVCGRKMA